jgi:hypothetical protein
MLGEASTNPTGIRVTTHRRLLNTLRDARLEVDGGSPMVRRWARSSFLWRLVAMSFDAITRSTSFSVAETHRSRLKCRTLTSLRSTTRLRFLGSTPERGRSRR